MFIIVHFFLSIFVFCFFIGEIKNDSFVVSIPGNYNSSNLHGADVIDYEDANSTDVTNDY